MTLVLNEEQRLLKDTAREFLQNTAPVEALRKLRDERDPQGYSQETWQQMVELGWSAVTLPEAYGGLEFGFMGLGAMIEESGRTLSASPLFATAVLGASVIELGGSEAQKSEWLPKVAEGSMTLALALEEQPRHNPAAVALSATAEGDSFVLNGKKTFVLDGHSADQLIVVARTEGEAGTTDGLSLFMVDGNAAGVTRKRTILVDSRNAANITFENVKVGADALIGELNQGWKALEPALDRGRICLAAEMLGGTLEVFERTIQYLNERKQFGVLIGSFQALKHRAAQMFCDVELAKSVVMDALSAIDEQRRDLSVVASLAKATMNDVYQHITNEGVQMHGGIGVTDELEVGFFLKRARTTTQMLGDSSYHKDRYATLRGY